MTPDVPPPFLRTLAPLLRSLEKRLRGWLDTRRKYPLSLLQRAEIEGVAEDLHRKAEALDVERPLLVVMLMGGTGVGKSTLMNALAGATVAQASFARPTTRDPVVYFHQTVKSDRLDPALQHCRLAQHDREALRQKILVDTPDLDSNDLANRDKLLELLPVADIVLYVGSQEKYHDRLGWDLFKDQRQRRAFAFVLNKWDRCLDAEAGLRPDVDWLRDLNAEGFENPRLFRTTAQVWVDAQATGGTPLNRVEGEQFPELVAWLEAGLTRLEIEAVKARGVGQLIDQTETALEGGKPPDFSAAAAKVRSSWEEILETEAEAQAEVLVGTLEPYQQEVEHHFSVRGQQNFWGLTAGYLRATTKLKYFTSGLRDKLPLGPKVGSKVETPDDWNLTEFVESCSKTAGERVLGQRLTALSNKLLLEADSKGFPLTLLSEPTAEATKPSWEPRFTRSLISALAEVEAEVTRPTGLRRVFRGGLTFFCNLLPPVVLLGSIAIVLYQLFAMDPPAQASIPLMLLPLYATLAVLVAIHLLVIIALPIRWSSIREQFRARLKVKLAAELGEVYRGIPDELAKTIRDEKKQTEALVAETKQVSDWLREREGAAGVADLYGK